MRPRTARRMAERTEQNRNLLGVAPTEYAAMTRNQRKHAVQRARKQQACAVCGGEAGDMRECVRCAIDADVVSERREDI